MDPGDIKVFNRTPEMLGQSIDACVSHGSTNPRLRIGMGVPQPCWWNIQRCRLAIGPKGKVSRATTGVLAIDGTATVWSERLSGRDKHYRMQRRAKDAVVPSKVTGKDCMIMRAFWLSTKYPRSM